MRADAVGATPWAAGAGAAADPVRAANHDTLSVATPRAKNIIDIAKHSAVGSPNSLDERLVARDNAYIDYLIQHGELRRFVSNAATTPTTGSDFEAATKLGSFVVTAGAVATPASPDVSSTIKAYNDAVTALTTTYTTAASVTSPTNTLFTTYAAHKLKVKATVNEYMTLVKEANLVPGSTTVTTANVDALFSNGGTDKICELKTGSGMGTFTIYGDITGTFDSAVKCKMRCLIKGRVAGDTAVGVADLYSDKFVPAWHLDYPAGDTTAAFIADESHCTGVQWNSGTNVCKRYKQSILQEATGASNDKCFIRTKSEATLTHRTNYLLSKIGGVTGLAFEADFTKVYDTTAGSVGADKTSVVSVLWPMYYVQKTRYTAAVAAKDAIYNATGGAGTLMDKIKAFAFVTGATDGPVATATLAASTAPLTDNPELLTYASQTNVAGGAWFDWA